MKTHYELSIGGLYDLIELYDDYDEALEEYLFYQQQGLFVAMRKVQYKHLHISFEQTI